MQRVDPRVKRTRSNVLRVAAEILLTRGWDHVTNAAVAKEAGYSKATLYKHWPEPLDLLRAAFLHIGGIEFHGEVTGDLRTDLIAELDAYRVVLTEHRLAGPLIGLADRARTDPDLASIRDQFLAEGQAPTLALIRHGVASHLLRSDLPITPTADLLSGALTWRVAVLGESVDRAYVVDIVDTVLRGVLRPENATPSANG
ncbi:MAG: TetR/AcrR family transcriptional regulator [Myxococcota bacterium]